MRIRDALLAPLGILLGVGLAHGQMTPLEDRRELTAFATHAGNTQTLVDAPASAFAYFDSFLGPLVEDESGSTQSAADQVSAFYPAAINASGTTGGYWTGSPGAYGALSRARFKFHVDTVIDYQLHVWLEPGDFVGSGQFLLQASPAPVTYYDLSGGELHETGRLAPGDYWIEGRSSFTTGIESFQAGTYAFVLLCSISPNVLIAHQPDSLTVPCGSTATFTVGTVLPPASLTFQWRRDGVPLVDDGHTSGVTSPQLSIDDACDPDIGYYDVLVSDGVTVEPSRPAHLGIGSTAAVEPAFAAPSNALTLELAGPSPFTTGTSFRYVAPASCGAQIAVYDLTGARIRTLADRVTAGSGVVTWDGRTRAGVRAPAGVYFLRIEAGSLQASRRVVLLK